MSAPTPIDDLWSSRKLKQNVKQDNVAGHVGISFVELVERWPYMTDILMLQAPYGTCALASGVSCMLLAARVRQSFQLGRRGTYVMFMNNCIVPSILCYTFCYYKSMQLLAVHGADTSFYALTAMQATASLAFGVCWPVITFPIYCLYEVVHNGLYRFPSPKSQRKEFLQFLATKLYPLRKPVPLVAAVHLIAAPIATALTLRGYQRIAFTAEAMPEMLEELLSQRRTTSQMFQKFDENLKRFFSSATFKT